MKKILTIVLVAFTAFAQAQDLPMIGKENSTRHKGFFLSMAYGPSRFDMDINYKKSNNNYSITERGAIIDIKIGGTIGRNLMLHSTLLSENITGYKAKSNGFQSDLNLNKDNSITTSFWGVGLTHYTDNNWYTSGSIGFTDMRFKYQNDSDYEPETGFGFQFKAGKEWWVGPRWGLGFGVYYNYLGISSDLENHESEEITANNFGVVFNATLNGKRSHKIKR